ncbi:MAG: hypothetical protein ACI4PG_02230 [Candidatus Ventricola sp.]
MEHNMLQFPVMKRQPSGLLTDEERAIAAENLSRVYADQEDREAAHRSDAREITPETFAARVAYQHSLSQPTPNADGVRVGDLFCGSWGYEQTNVDFFQVVALRGRHTAVLRGISGDYIGGFSWMGNVRPCRDSFTGTQEYTVRTKIVDWYGKPRLMLRHPTATGHYLDPITDDKEVGYSSYA